MTSKINLDISSSIIYNTRMKRKGWTMKERQILKKYYNVVSAEELAVLLPDRDPKSITNQVYYLRKRGWTFVRPRDNS